MLMNCLLAGASASLVTGYFYFLSEKKYSKIFTEVEKSVTMDFDYLRNVNDIPGKKTTALCARTDEQSSKQSAFNEKKMIAFSCVLPQMTDKADRMWTVRRPFYQFFVVNTKGERLLIDISDREVICFNLKEINTNIPESKISAFGSVSTPLNLFRSKQVKGMYTEYGIEADENFVAVGVRSNNPVPQHFTENFQVKYQFDAKYLLGEKKEHFLKHLDELLVKYNKRGKIAFSAAAGFTVIHLATKFIFANMKKQAQIEQQMRGEVTGKQSSNKK
eukprot:TRINITY_DN10000_c0_g1_i1.p1 TRINITY_DN10000_c0_g1~~TRINITY_DN10000_c0_g1_i1.p1  ORF type:complete len:275 (-),score=60.20 TRINITY_DN10000_c0_g1_i1:166-990(-)